MTAVNQESLLGDLIPDVYIRKITLESSGTTLVEDNPHVDHERERISQRDKRDTDSLIVTLDLLMKEKLNNDLIGTWFANQDLDKYLQIKVFQSTDPKVTALLSAGSDLLDLVDPTERIPNDDVRMKLAATVFNVQSAEQVFDIMEKKVSFKKMGATKTGTGVKPKITQYKESLDSDGNRVYDITFKQRFELRTAHPEHLAYFALTSLDLQALARDFEIDFDSIGLRKMNGKITSDLVIDDFEIVNQTFSFIDMQGRIWTGPVHKLPSGQFRTGDSENENSFDLTRFATSNTKLQDFRDIKEIERLILDFSAIENNSLQRNITKILSNSGTAFKHNPAYFSSMSLARDKDGDAKFFFSVDFEKLTQENSVFGRLFTAANPRLKMSMLRRAQIRSMKVYRQRIKENTSLNRLGSPHGLEAFDKNEPLELVACSSEKSWKQFVSTKFSTGTLKEVELFLGENSPMVRHFSGMDLSMSEVTDGLYRYVVEIEVDDASVEFLLEKVQELLKSKSILERYAIEASAPSMSRYLEENRNSHIEHPSEHSKTKGQNSGAFDVASNRFTQHFIESQRSKYKGKKANSAPWIAPIAVYSDILDLFTNVFDNEKERKRVLKSLYSYVSPNTGNPNGILAVVALIDKLASSIAQAIGVTLTTSVRRFDGSTSSTLQSPIVTKSRTSRKTFKVTKFFDQIFDSDIVKGIGIDYLSSGEDETNNIDGLRVINNSEYVSRANLETLKYFKSPEPNIDMSFGGEQITERDSIKNTNLSFLSPSRIDLAKRSIVLSEGGRKTLESGEKKLASPKNKMNRFIEHIDDGTTEREDVATEICSLILYSNSLNSPGTYSSNRSIGNGNGTSRLSSRGKKKNDQTKISEETVHRTMNNYFTEQASLTIKPIRVKVLKDPRDGFVVLEPVPEPRRSEISQDCQSIDNEVDSVVIEQEESDSFLKERTPLNVFYQMLSKPALQRGSSNIKDLKKPNFTKKEGTITSKKRNVSSISSFDLKNLRVVSTANSSEGTKTVHGLNQIMTENQMKQLPNQLKALFLQTASQNVIRSTKLQGLKTSDTSEKSRYAASLTLDYEMLVQVEYFAGYETSEDDSVSIKKPIWRLLTDDANNSFSGKEILCRFVPYTNTALGLFQNKGLKTAIYDEYFVLRPKNKEIDNDDTTTSVKIDERMGTIDVQKSIIEEIHATDNQVREINDEFTSNNFVTQKAFSKEVEILKSKGMEESTYKSVLSSRIGEDFVKSLNINEAQAQILLNAIPPGAKTQVDAQNSLNSLLREMEIIELKDVSPLEVSSTEGIPMSTIVKLIKKRF